MVAAAALPFQFGDLRSRCSAWSPCSCLAAIAAAVRMARAEHGDDYPGDALTVIEAAAWLGIYLLVNLVVSSGILHPGSRLDLPLDHLCRHLDAAGRRVVDGAARARAAAAAGSSLAMALGTLLSNKEYLGSPRYEWDPIVFGVLLMGIAIGRAALAGVGRRAACVTATRRRAWSPPTRRCWPAWRSCRARTSNVPVASTAPAPDSAIGGGGRSGGGGAGGSF